MAAKKNLTPKPKYIVLVEGDPTVHYNESDVIEDILDVTGSVYAEDGENVEVYAVGEQVDFEIIPRSVVLFPKEKKD